MAGPSGRADASGAGPRLPELRFRVGDRVLANVHKEGRCFKSGTVTELWWSEPEWLPDQCVPYQVLRESFVRFTSRGRCPVQPPAGGARRGPVAAVHTSHSSR